MCIQLLQSFLTLRNPADCRPPFFRQEYCSGLPCPPPGGLPDPELEPASLRFSALAGGTFTARDMIYTQPNKL